LHSLKTSSCVPHPIGLAHIRARLNHAAKLYSVWP
jgi:hypothetical protein